MTPRILIRERARQDLDAIADYIAVDSIDAALRFYAAAQETIRRLAGRPGMGSLREFEDPRLADVRSWAIKGFRNYLLFYRPVRGGIEIIRVLHGARDIDRAIEE